jgi:hypothetical protein
MLNFKQFCHQLDEKKDTEKRMDAAYKKKQREKKIKKLLAFNSHWRGLS